MELTYEEVEQHLTNIFSDIRYVYVDDFLLLFKFPSNKIKQRASLVYKRSFDSAVSGGILPVVELEKLIDSRNLITAEEILTLNKLKGQLEAQQILLGKTTRVKANQERIKQAINRLKHNIRQIEFKRSSKLLMSAENKAEEDKTFFVCSRCVYREDETLFWPTHDEALKENRINLKDSIVMEYLRFYSGLSVEIVRAVARSSLWRIRYVNSMKTSDPLFGVPASQYTTDQLNLVYWSNYYQSIYEMMPDDRPKDIVIEDDELLDAYMKAFYEERNRETMARKSKSNRSGKLSAFDSDEVIVTRAHELYEDIKYDTPREAQKVKDRVDLKKRTKRGKGR